MTKRIVQQIRKRLMASVVRRNIAYTLGRQILASVAQLLLVVLIARALGPEGNGFYAMAILLPNLMVNFLNLGVGPATVYYLGRGDNTLHQAVPENIRLGGIIVGIGIIGALPIMFFFHPTLFPRVPPQVLFLGFAAFPPSLLLAYLNTILQGMEDFRAFNWTTLVPPYLTLAVAWGALYVLGLGIEAAVTAFLIGQLAGLIAVLFFLYRKIHETQVKSLPGHIRGYKRKVLSYGWKAHLSNMLAFVNYRADIFLVNFFLTPAATGIYVIAVQFAERLWMLSKAASTVLLPRLSAMHEDPAARLALTKKGFIVVAAVTALVSIVAALALYWLIGPIFGAEYQEALPAFLWLLPGIIAGAGSRVQSNCIAAAGKPEWNMYVALGVVTMNVVGNIILVPQYGIIGAAWATSLAYSGNAVVKMYLVQRTREI